MARPFPSIALTVVVSLAISTTLLLAQELERPLSFFPRYKTLRLDEESAAKVRHAIEVAHQDGNLPMWNYTVTSPIDGKTYSGTMVGATPFFNGARTTNIPTYIVPLIVNLPDGGVFDPTVLDKCSPVATPLAQVQSSPVFTTTQFVMNGVYIGNTQYIDAFQRANFWGSNVSVTGDNYHTVLYPISTAEPVTINIPSGQGATFKSGCPHVGVVDFATFDSIVTKTAFPALAAQGVSPASFPLFVLHDLVLGDPGDSLTKNCCVFGYHGAFLRGSGVGSGRYPVQTYAVADYDTAGLFPKIPDIAPTSHVVGEWITDPFGTNQTPSWSSKGKIASCQNNLEAGDPLVGSIFRAVGPMPNGITYHPQELAFFSWFYRQTPSLGAGGVYSDNGSFLAGQPTICTSTPSTS